MRISGISAARSSGVSGRRVARAAGGTSRARAAPSAPPWCPDGENAVAGRGDGQIGGAVRAAAEDAEQRMAEQACDGQAAQALGQRARSAGALLAQLAGVAAAEEEGHDRHRQARSAGLAHRLQDGVRLRDADPCGERSGPRMMPSVRRAGAARPTPRARAEAQDRFGRAPLAAERVGEEVALARGGGGVGGSGGSSWARRRPVTAGSDRVPRWRRRA